MDSRHTIREEQRTAPDQKKDDVFKKFLETREIVLARQKKRELEEGKQMKEKWLSKKHSLNFKFTPFQQLVWVVKQKMIERSTLLD